MRARHLLISLSVRYEQRARGAGGDEARAPTRRPVSARAPPLAFAVRAAAATAPRHLRTAEPRRAQSGARAQRESAVELQERTCVLRFLGTRALWPGVLPDEYSTIRVPLREQVRSLVVELVLSTDLTRHVESVTQLRMLASRRGFALTGAHGDSWRSPCAYTVSARRARPRHAQTHGSTHAPLHSAHGAFALRPTRATAVEPTRGICPTRDAFRPLWPLRAQSSTARRWPSTRCSPPSSSSQISATVRARARFTKDPSQTLTLSPHRALSSCHSTRPSPSTHTVVPQAHTSGTEDECVCV
eukprot:3566441-Prymnesium_polylepis.1